MVSKSNPNKSLEVSNWWIHEVGWINGPWLPNIQWLIFTIELRASGVPDFPYSQSFWSSKSLDCWICFQVSFLDKRLRLTLSLWASGISKPLIHKSPRVSNYRISPLFRPHVISRWMVRIHTTLWSFGGFSFLSLPSEHRTSEHPSST